MHECWQKKVKRTWCLGFVCCPFQSEACRTWQLSQEMGSICVKVCSLFWVSADDSSKIWVRHNKWTLDKRQSVRWPRSLKNIFSVSWPNNTSPMKRRWPSASGKYKYNYKYNFSLKKKMKTICVCAAGKDTNIWTKYWHFLGPGTWVHLTRHNRKWSTSNQNVLYFSKYETQVGQVHTLRLFTLCY